MSRRAPTRREMEVLRYLACGMTIGPPAHLFAHRPVLAKDVVVINLQHATVARLRSAGWLDDEYRITTAGRDVAEVKAFVRAFSERKLL